jgi:hypothetical protein
MLKKILAFTCLTLSIGANSASLVVTDGTLMGATDVDVGGSLYDVSFLDGSCNSLFDGCRIFTFNTQATAELASTALLDQVLIGVFDVNPHFVNGINDDFVSYIFTPYSTWSSGTYVNVGGALNDAFGVIDEAGWGRILGRTYDTSGLVLGSDEVYAVWSPSPVPLPAAAWLFISAIAGLAGAKRITRSKNGT